MNLFIYVYIYAKIRISCILFGLQVWVRKTPCLNLRVGTTYNKQQSFRFCYKILLRFRCFQFRMFTQDRCHKLITSNNIRQNTKSSALPNFFSYTITFLSVFCVSLVKPDFSFGINTYIACRSNLQPTWETEGFTILFVFIV